MEERIRQGLRTRRECRRWVSEIVEDACRTAEPNSELRRHLSACAACTARWEQQRSLTLAFEQARQAARDRIPASGRREQLMQQFAAGHRPKYSLARTWLAAAAALLLAVALGYAVLDRGGAPAGKRPSLAANVVPPVVEETAAEPASSDDDGFVPVPDAPPLASGEFVSVVRTELQAAALARMGIYVDASYGLEVPAEVEVGEDGLPRAVRVIGAIEF